MRLIQYFRKEYNLEIKSEEADLYLTSFATLYEAMGEAGAADPARLKAAEPPPDLISPHSCKEGFHS